jgi:hypothetical protein
MERMERLTYPLVSMSCNKHELEVGANWCKSRSSDLGLEFAKAVKAKIQ